MVARLKLKEIDGRAPPGVKLDSAASLPLKAVCNHRRVGALNTASRYLTATSLKCGKTLKPPATKPP